MSRRMLIAACLSLFAADAAFADNVLLIIADDLGTTGVGCYGEGADPAPTPTIDGLAQQGLLFRNAWSNPVCSPTRAGILTGRYSFRTGVGMALTPLSPPAADLKRREVILPEILSGPRALIGKWHLDEGRLSPNRHGWPYFSGTIQGSLLNYFDWLKTTNGRVRRIRRYATTETVDDAIQWISEQSSGEDWFLDLSFQTPHTPIHAPPDDLHSFDLTGLDPRTTPVPFYKAMVEAMDREIGRLLQHVPADTTIIFIGDNGPDPRVVEAPYSPLKAKASVFEGGVHVPFIVAGPVVASPGREVDALVHTVDLFTTIADLLGASANTGVDSVSIVPYLTDPGQQPIRNTMYADVFILGNPALGNAAIRNARYKLLKSYLLLGAEQMYDLSMDPLEEHDLLKSQLSPDAKAAYQSLSAELKSLRGSESRGWLNKLLAGLKGLF